MHMEVPALACLICAWYCVCLVSSCSKQHCAAWCSVRSLCCAQTPARLCHATLPPEVPTLLLLALQEELHSKPHACLVSGQPCLASRGTEGEVSAG